MMLPAPVGFGALQALGVTLDKARAGVGLRRRLPAVTKSALP